MDHFILTASSPQDLRHVVADYLYDQGKDLESEAMRSGMFEEDFSGVGRRDCGHGNGTGWGCGREVSGDGVGSGWGCGSGDWVGSGSGDGEGCGGSLGSGHGFGHGSGQGNPSGRWMHF